MKKAIVIVILILAALLSGCVETERIYYSQDVPEDTLTLKTDGKYQLTVEGRMWTGEYEESKDTLILHMQPPFPSFVLQKEGENWRYTDNDGTDLWIPKK